MAKTIQKHLLLQLVEEENQEDKDANSACSTGHC